MIFTARSLVLAMALIAPIAVALSPNETTALASVFDYDRTESLALTEIGRGTREGAVVLDVTFPVGGKSVVAYVVTPEKPVTGSCAAILYVHWLGEPATTNRTEFLDEAVALARRGVVSVLVDAMWAQPKWYGSRIPEEDYTRSIRQVIELRRSMDVLLAQPGVDPKRVAFVGHDFGAMYGMIAAGLEPRAKTYVFLAPTPHFIDWFLFARKPKDLDAYRAQLAPIDPVRFVAKLAPARAFFQFASHDEYVSTEKAAEFYAAAAAPKHAATYVAGHDLHTPEVAADRVAWLEGELGLK